MLFKKVLTLNNGKRKHAFLWDVLLFCRRTFSIGEDIIIPSDKILTMHSPIINGELYIDGEGFLE